MAPLGLILRTPAIVISFVGLASLPVGIIAGGFVGPIVSFALVLFFLAWMLAVHETAARHLGEAAGQAARWLFGVVVTVLLIQVAIMPFAWEPPKPLETLLAIAGTISFFALAYLAGRRLALASGGKAGGLAFSLFLAIVYLPIGIWFLRRRVAMVARAI